MSTNDDLQPPQEVETQVTDADRDLAEALGFTCGNRYHELRIIARHRLALASRPGAATIARFSQTSIEESKVSLGRIEKAPPADEVVSDSALAEVARKALGTWLAWPDAPRDGPTPVTNEQAESWLHGLPNTLARAPQAPVTGGDSILIAALAKGGVLMTEPSPTPGFPRARKMMIGFENPDHADEAMQAIANAVRSARADLRPDPRGEG